MSAQEHKIKVRALYSTRCEVSSLCLECSCGWEQCFDDTVDLETLLGAHKIEVPATKKLLYEVVEADMKGEWLVEALNIGEGEIYSTLFYGSDAEKRAREYANFKNGADGMKPALKSLETYSTGSGLLKVIAKEDIPPGFVAHAGDTISIDGVDLVILGVVMDSMFKRDKGTVAILVRSVKP